jgi:hypothetical protein
VITALETIREREKHSVSTQGGGGGEGASVNPLNPELNPLCYLLALLEARHFLHVSRIRVKSLTLRQLMSYTYIYIYIYIWSTYS